MKEQVIIKLSILIAILVVVIFIWYFRPQHVKLELVESVQNVNISVNDGISDFNSELHWWFIGSYPESNSQPQLGTVSPDLNSQRISYLSLQNWGIDFDELGIDFDKNNIILAFSRKIKEMKFKRADGFPYQTVSNVKTIMSKEFEQHTVYIYRIPKYDVHEDFRAYTETSVEK